MNYWFTCEKITYDGLIRCDVDLQMHQLDEERLSTYNKLKERKKIQRKHG